MPAHLPPHSHCLNCEEPIKEGEVFCSNACEVEQKKKGKKERQRMIVFYLLVLVAVAVIWLVASLVIH